MTSDLSKSKLAKSVVLGLVLGSMVGYGIADAATVLEVSGGNHTEHTNAALAATDASTKNQIGETIVKINGTTAYPGGTYASGLIATNNSTIYMIDPNNVIKTDATNGPIYSADAIYVAGGGTVEMKGKTISIAGKNTVFGVENAGGTVIVNGLTTFSVEASDSTGTGNVTGVSVTSSAGTNTLKDLNTDLVVTANGVANGILASAGTNNVDGVKDIVITSTGGSASGIQGSSGGKNNINKDAQTQLGTLAVTASGGDAYGIVAHDSGTVNTVAGLGAVTAKGVTNTDAIYADGGKNIVNHAEDTGRGDITAISTSSSADGVYAMNGGMNEVYGYENIKAIGEQTMGSPYADNYGVLAMGTNSLNTITLNGTGTIEVSGTYGDATGVSAQDGGKDIIKGVTSIKASSTTLSGTYGIYASNGTIEVAKADGSGVDVTAEETGMGGATGIIAKGNSTVGKINNVTATANSNEATGVRMGTGTNTIIGINNITATTTSGPSAVGVSANGGTNSLDVAGNLKVTNTSGVTAVGVTNAGADSFTVKIQGQSEITAAQGIAALVTNPLAKTLDVTVNGATTVTGATALLVKSNSDGTTTVTGGTGTQVLQGTDKAIAVDITNKGMAGGTVAGGTVQLTDLNLAVAGPENASYAVYSAYNEATGADYGGGTVKLVNTNISGAGTNGGADVYFGNDDGFGDGVDLVLDLDQTSSLTGKITAVDTDYLHAVALNNAGLWNVTGSSNLNASGASSITNTGTIDMTKDGTTAAQAVSSTIKVNNLVNNGQLIMDVSPAGNASGDSKYGDMIQTATASGSGTIKVNIPAGELAAITGQAYLEDDANALVTVTETNSSNYTVNNNGDNRLEAGNWIYGLQASTTETGATVYKLAKTGELSNKGATVVNSLVSPDYWYLETNALYSDLNNFDGARKDHDVWAHAVHNKQTIKDRTVSVTGAAGADVDDIDNKYNGIVVGIDKRVSVTKNGSFWAGIMGGYGRGSNDFGVNGYGYSGNIFSSGDADTDSAHVGIYGVYRTTTNWYVGSILKYNHYRTDVKTSTTAGSEASVASSGVMDQNGLGISIIGGKRFKNNKGWFVEPQLELGYHRIADTAYNLGDMHVNVDAMTSKRARLGINFGRNIAYQNGANLDVFAQASLVHEFGGEGRVTTSYKDWPDNPDNLNVEYGGSWGMYKLGVNYNTVKGDNAMFALTYNKGGHRSSPVGFELAYNWTF